MSEPHDGGSPTRTERTATTEDGGSPDETVERLAELERRVTELEATTQALRGYVGGVRAVDEAVERRANAALAAVNRLESEEVGDDGAPENVGAEVDSDEEVDSTADDQSIASRLRETL